MRQPLTAQELADWEYWQQFGLIFGWKLWAFFGRDYATYITDASGDRLDISYNQSRCILRVLDMARGL